MTILSEPGFWVLAALPGFGLVHLGAAFVARRRMRRILTLTDEILADPRANESDRSWVRAALSDTDGFGAGWFGFFAPFMAFGLIVVGLWDIVRGKGPLGHEDDERWLETARRETDALQAQGVLLETGTDPRHGALWKDRRRGELSRLQWNLADLQSPFAAVWTYLWLSLAVMTLAAFIGLHAATIYAAERSKSFSGIASQRLMRMLSPTPVF